MFTLVVDLGKDIQNKLKIKIIRQENGWKTYIFHRNQWY